MNMTTAGDATVREHLDAIEREGYTIIEDVLDSASIDAALDELARIERESAIEPARNAFEGHHTWRIYNLLARGPIWQRFAIDPRVLPVVEGVLDEGCLVSSLSSIAIGSDETPQMLHSDDQVIGLPRPHPALVCNTMWAWGKRCPNRTDARRVGIAMNYCAGFIRQQENQHLGIPREIAATFPPRLKELVGHGTCRRLLGHIDKRNPAFLLGDEGEMKTIWD